MSITNGWTEADESVASGDSGAILSMEKHARGNRFNVRAFTIHSIVGVFNFSAREQHNHVGRTLLPSSSAIGREYE